MRTISKLRARIRRRVRRNRETLKLHYGHNREKQFRAANLLTTIWWTNSIILALLLVFICLPSGLLDMRSKPLFTVLLLTVGLAFVGCYQLVLRNKFMTARRIIIGGTFLTTGLSTIMTGGFPHSVTTPTLLIPIILSYCTYGGRVSHMSTAVTVGFLLIQYAASLLFGVTFPDLAAFANPQINSILVLATTFAIVIMAMISLDISTKTYIERADRAAESKSNFLANMSHELRTPLNGVIGLTDVMLKTQLDKNQQVYMDAIDVSGKSLFSIITDILDFSKIESGYVEVKHEEFNLRETLDEVIAQTSENCDNSAVKLHLFYPKDCPEILTGDKEKLDQIVRKLVGNALKFTQEGYVSIKVAITSHPTRERLKIEVQDTGIGISKKHRKQIFDQFTQGESSTTKKYGGTGLGLAITKRLVELMNGDIGVVSKLGVGSTFWFEVDTDFEGAKQPLPDIAPRIEKTLLITPQPDICNTLFTQISQDKNRVFTAPPGQNILSFINDPGFKENWSSNVFIDDMSDTEEANAFLASFEIVSKQYDLKVVRVSSLDRAGRNNTSQVKLVVNDNELRRYG